MMLRKEKELEQEMEKLAKEKVAQHSRIQELKRDLTAMSEQGIVFPSSGDADTVVRERCKYPKSTNLHVCRQDKKHYTVTGLRSSIALATFSKVIFRNIHLRPCCKRSDLLQSQLQTSQQNRSLQSTMGLLTPIYTNQI